MAGSLGEMKIASRILIIVTFRKDGEEIEPLRIETGALVGARMAVGKESKQIRRLVGAGTIAPVLRLPKFRESSPDTVQRSLGDA